MADLRQGLVRASDPLWLVNSTIAAVGSVVLSMVVSVLAGYALSRFHVRGGQSLGLFILTAKMLPATLLVIPLFAVFRQLGMIGSCGRWSSPIRDADHPVHHLDAEGLFRHHPA